MPENVYVIGVCGKTPLTFTLAASGHIAGVVNPPSANKYGYWTNAALPAKPGNPDAGVHQGISSVAQLKQ